LCGMSDGVRLNTSSRPLSEAEMDQTTGKRQIRQMNISERLTKSTSGRKLRLSARGRELIEVLLTTERR